MSTKIYKNLKRGFRQSGFKFIFQNTDLAKQLMNKSITFSEFLNTYRSAKWWIRWWFRLCIQDIGYRNEFDKILSVINAKQSDELNSLVKLLEQANILTFENLIYAPMLPISPTS